MLQLNHQTCFLWCISLQVIVALVPDETLLQQQRNSGLKIVDWTGVSKVVLNRRVTTNDPRQQCCSTNFSAAWDLDGEIIAIVVDNLFCADTVNSWTTEILHPYRDWETMSQAVNRVHKHGPSVSEFFYNGMFPGVTSMMRSSKDSMMMLRRCFQPYLKTILDSEQVYVLSQVLEERLTQSPIHRDDNNEPVEVIETDQTIEVDNTGQTIVHRNNGEDEDGEDDEDDENNNLNILNNPVFPNYLSSFWASVSLPAMNITHMHSAPHTDGTTVGYASVYTLTKNKSYHATATTFNQMRQSNFSILTDSDQVSSFGKEVQVLQERATNAGESPDSGWLNQSSNRFSNVIAMAYNAHNRFTMYPSNRLHTAYVPNENLLQADPSKGRLSMNTFWHLYESNDKFCTNVNNFQAKSNYNHSFGVHVPNSMEQVVGLCSACTAWPNHCQWCVATQECVARGTEFCPNNQLVGANQLHTSLTCEDAAANGSSCLAHTSCKTCSNNGCSWCSAIGICKNSVDGYSPCTKHQNSEVLPFHPETCKEGYKHQNCDFNLFCHTCRDAGCAWCPSANKCVPKTQQSSCPFGNHGKQSKIATSCTKVETKMKLRILTNDKDCAQFDACTTCIDMVGCAWCFDDESEVNGKCFVDKPRACQGPAFHISKSNLLKDWNRPKGEKPPRTECPAKKKLQLTAPPTPTNSSTVVVVMNDNTENFLADVPSNYYNVGSVAKIETLSSFENTLAFHQDVTGLPLVVKFTSKNCGPCATFAPIYIKKAKQYKGRIAFVDVDVDTNLDTTRKCEVESVPHFQIFEEGKKVKDLLGVRPKEFGKVMVNVADRFKNKESSCVGKFISEKSLVEFYKRHDVEKANDAKEVIAKFGNKIAKLLRVLLKLYGNKPDLDNVVSTESNHTTSVNNDHIHQLDQCVSPALIQSFTSEQLRDELLRRSVSLDDTVGEYEWVEQLDKGRATHARPAKVVILGGGPAGLAAAIYSARAGLEPIVIAPVLGGQLLGKGIDVENFPGVFGIDATGHGIVNIMRKQVFRFNATMIDDTVVDLDVSTQPYTITINGSTDKIHAHAIILATGSDSRWLGAPGENRYRGKGISSCATCDAFLYRNRRVAVVGGGDTAMEDALLLARTSKNVTIVHRRDAFRASHALVTRVLNHPSIQIMWNTVVEKFIGNDDVENDKDGNDLTGVVLKSNVDGKNVTTTLDIEAAFVAIGHDPNTGFLRKSGINIDQHGNIATSKPGLSTFTNIKGIFACGDVADSVYRQAITSAGSGAMAAMDADRWLSANKKQTTQTKMPEK